MNRDYINWLETLPCNRKPQKVNVWMGEWAPLPEHVDLPRYEEIQQEWNQRDCPNGMMSRLAALSVPKGAIGIPLLIFFPCGTSLFAP